MTGTARHDVVIVGGGPAGLSAALVLGRSRRDVVLLDAGAPRNAAAGHLQGYLGRDGTPPAEFLELGRAEVRAYGVRITPATVTELLPEAEPGWVLVTVEAPDPPVAGVPSPPSRMLARRVIVATGLQDALPEIPDLAGRWGRDVMHCPYCHGWEIRDEPVVVLATRADEADKALTMTRWTDDVTLVLHGLTVDDLDADTRRGCAAVGVRVVEGPVRGLEVDAEDHVVAVRLGGGRSVPTSVVVIQPRVVAHDAALVRAGAEVTTGPFGQFVVTDETGATGIPGIWAAGNVCDPQAQVVVAAAAGYRAALAVDHDLILEDVDHAVRAQAS